MMTHGDVPFGIEILEFIRRWELKDRILLRRRASQVYRTCVCYRLCGRNEENYKSYQPGNKQIRNFLFFSYPPTKHAIRMIYI